jgi:hypothetical protein
MRLRVRTLAVLGAFALVSLTMAPPTTADPGSWDLRGNAGTSPGFHFLGTTDDKALVVKVNGRRALLIRPASGTPNLIGGPRSTGWPQASTEPQFPAAEAAWL